MRVRGRECHGEREREEACEGVRCESESPKGSITEREWRLVRE